MMMMMMMPVMMMMMMVMMTMTMITMSHQSTLLLSHLRCQPVLENSYTILRARRCRHDECRRWGIEDDSDDDVVIDDSSDGDDDDDSNEASLMNVFADRAILRRMVSFAACPPCHPRNPPPHAPSCRAARALQLCRQVIRLLWSCIVVLFMRCPSLGRRHTAHRTRHTSHSHTPLPRSLDMRPQALEQWQTLVRLEANGRVPVARKAHL
jgi:hypothetical protein